MLRLEVALATLLSSATILAGTVARAAPPPVEAYGRLPAIEDVALSPAGDRLAFVTVVKDQRKVVVQTLGGDLLQTVGIGADKVRGLDWADNGHLLVSASNRVELFNDPDFAFEGFTVHVVNMKSHEAHQIFWRMRGVLPLVFGDYGVTTTGEGPVAYFSAIALGTDQIGTRLGQGVRLQGGYPDLYKVNLDTGSGEMVSRGRELNAGWALNEQGAPIARSLLDEKTGRWCIYAADGGRVLVSGDSTFEHSVLEGLGRAPETVLYADTQTSGTTYKEISLKGGSGVELISADGEVSDLLHDPRTHRLVAATVEGDAPETRVFEPVLAASYAKALKAFRGKQVHLASFSSDYSKLIVETEGDGDAGVYYLIDLTTGQALIVGERYPDIKAENVGPTRIFHYKASDGLPLEGVLTLPPGGGAKGLPVVVLPHGGPEARDHLRFDWWAQAFASRGYAVFQPNFRGSGGFGVAFRDKGFGQWGRKMQSDVSDGLAALAADGTVDPKRACIVGGSYGGYAALAGVTVQTGLYRCAVSVAGVADLNAMLNWEQNRAGERSATTRYWRTFMGARGPSDPAMQALSPDRLATRADAPVLLVHGRDDTIVPITQSRTMEAALKRAGKPVEFVEMPGEDHWLSREATRVAMLKASIAFVEKHNPPG